MTWDATGVAGSSAETEGSSETEPADRFPPLPRSFFERPAHLVAPDLLGLLLIRREGRVLSGGLIVEAEAYGGPGDLASHARAGRTTRTAPMFGPAGHAYVYLVYGMHHCLNVVTEGDRQAGAVLLRALEPTLGLESIRTRRGRPDEPDGRLAAGPARLCQALAIDRRFDAADLCRAGELWLSRPSDEEGEARRVISGPRIGVAYAGDGWADRPWRFGLAGHPSLSRPFPGTSQRT
jgi:DNA-3-methyladenine glycosylase